MTPLQGAFGGTELIAWRLETSKHFPTWQTAEGAFLVGGRWSSAGRRVLYTSIDPATAIVEVGVHEVGVHKGFNTLDAVPHTRPGTISAEQQSFGDGLLASNPLVVVPSVVSTHSWNLLIDVAGAAGLFSLRGSEAFALDSRLNPTAAAIPRP